MQWFGLVQLFGQFLGLLPEPLDLLAQTSVFLHQPKRLLVRSRSALRGLDFRLEPIQRIPGVL